MAGIDIRKIEKGRKPHQSSKEGKSLSDFLNKDIAFLPHKFTDKKKEAFYLEFGIMISAGLDIRAALDLIENEHKSLKDRNLVKGIKDKVIDGYSLSQALKESGLFSAYECFSVQIGEETGKLPEVLKQLTQYYTSKLKQRRQFISALSYPSVIFFTSVLAVSFMLSFIVPMFSDVFKRFGGELPGITQFIIDLSSLVSSNFIYFLLLICGFGVFLWIYRKAEWMRKTKAGVILKIPVFGPLVSAIYLSRFCASMGLLIGSKVPLLRAIELVKQMVDFYPVTASLAKVEEDVLQGRSLHDSLGRFSIYNAKMIALIRVGEEVNKLDVFFNTLSKNLLEDIEHKTSLLSAFLEPMMIIFLGLVVGFILVAMYMPMFQLSTGIGG